MTRGGQGSLKYATAEERAAAKASYKEAYKRAEIKYMNKLKSDPILYEAYLKRKAADKTRARKNPEVRKITNERTSKCCNEIKQLRQQVIDLNNRFPLVLTDEEKYNLKAANRCRSLKYLKYLKEKFREVQDEDLKGK